MFNRVSWGKGRGEGGHAGGFSLFASSTGGEKKKRRGRISCQRQSFRKPPPNPHHPGERGGRIFLYWREGKGGGKEREGGVTLSSLSFLIYRGGGRWKGEKKNSLLFLGQWGKKKEKRGDFLLFSRSRPWGGEKRRRKKDSGFFLRYARGGGGKKKGEGWRDTFLPSALIGGRREKKKREKKGEEECFCATVPHEEKEMKNQVPLLPCRCFTVWGRGGKGRGGDDWLRIRGEGREGSEDPAPLLSP